MINKANDNPNINNSYVNALQAKLSKRHILMMALGSAIGTGFFYGAGESLKLTGPSILLAYLIGGVMMYIIVRALGEMAVAEPSSGSFSYYAYRYIGNYAGFIAGWNYWFNYIIVSMLELTATSLFLSYWFPSIAAWKVTLAIMLIFTLINILHVKVFGEFEFWFAGIKIIAILSFIGFGIYILGFQHQQNQVSHLSNLWLNNNFFAGGLSGFLFSFVVVLFSFGGTELIGVTAGEASDPAKTIPLAINGTIFRIVIFYITTLAIVICLYPWNKINTSISPFIDVFQQIGISKAASLMNLVAITAALSSLNSGIYGTARMAYNLGNQGNAPKFLTYSNKNGVPINAIFLSTFCIALTVIINYIYPHKALNLLLAIATSAAIINWSIILIAHACFRNKKLSVLSNPLTYRLWAYPYTSFIASIFLLMIAIVMFFMPSMHLAIIITPVWIIILSIIYLFKIKLFASLKI